MKYKRLDSGRVMAIRDIPSINVRAGTFGGYIESESNLSQDGDAWVAGNAVVTSDAWVAGNAVVTDHAVVADSTVVTGNVVVSGEANRSKRN